MLPTPQERPTLTVQEVSKFLAEMDAKIEKLNKLVGDK